MHQKTNNRPAIVQACRWSLYFLTECPDPLFSCPGISFHLINGGVPSDAKSVYLPRSQVMRTPPTQLLQDRTRRAPRGCTASVLTYLLDEDGDIHSDPDLPPSKLLVMTHQGREEQVIRRILSVVDKGFSARLLPDHVTLFDLRFVAPSLAAKGLLTELVSTQRGQ